MFKRERGIFFKKNNLQIKKWFEMIKFVFNKYYLYEKFYRNLVEPVKTLDSKENEDYFR